MTSLSAASIQNNIGAIFLENGNVDEAMERFYAAIHICDTQEEVVMEEGQWPQLSLSSIDNDINDNDDNDIEIDNDCIINTISGGGNADKNGNNQSRNDPTSIIDICGVSFPSIRQDTVDKFTNVDTSGLMWFYNRKCREYLSSSSSTTTATTSTSSIAAVVSNSSSSPLHIMETTITFGLEYITVPTFSFSSSSSSSSSIKYTQEDAKCIALFNLARICANMDDLSFQENKSSSSSSSSSSLSSLSSIITPQSIQENNQRIQTLLTASLNELTKQQSSLNTCKTISSSFRLHGVRVQQQQHEQEQCKRNNYKLQCMIRNNLGVVQFGNHQPQEALQEFEVCLRLIQLLLSLEGGDDGNDNDGEVDPSTSYSSSTPYSTTEQTSSSSTTYSTRRNNGYPHGHSNSNYSSSTSTSSSSLSTQMMTNTTLPLSYLHMTTLFNLCRTYIRLNDCTKALQLSNEILNMDISTCNSHANATTTSSRIPLSTSPSTMEIETTQKMKWLQQTTKYYHQGLIQERQEHVTDALSNYNQMLALTRHKYGHGHMYVGLLLERKGGVLFHQRKLQNAMLSYLASLKIYETLESCVCIKEGGETIAIESSLSPRRNGSITSISTMRSSPFRPRSSTISIPSQPIHRSSSLPTPSSTTTTTTTTTSSSSALLSSQSKLDTTTRTRRNSIIGPPSFHPQQQSQQQQQQQQHSHHYQHHPFLFIPSLHCIPILSNIYHEAQSRVYHSIARTLHDREDYADALNVYQKALYQLSQTIPSTTTNNANNTNMDHSPSTPSSSQPTTTPPSPPRRYLVEHVRISCNIARIYRILGDLSKAITINLEIVLMATQMVSGTTPPLPATNTTNVSSSTSTTGSTTNGNTTTSNSVSSSSSSQKQKQQPTLSKVIQYALSATKHPFVRNRLVIQGNLYVENNQLSSAMQVFSSVARSAGNHVTNQLFVISHARPEEEDIDRNAFAIRAAGRLGKLFGRNGHGGGGGGSEGSNGEEGNGEDGSGGGGGCMIPHSAAA